MLDTFSGFPFFNLEEMHLIGHGIAHHLFDLSAVTLRGDTKHVSLYRKSEEEKDEDYGYTFDIPKQDITRKKKLRTGAILVVHGRTVVGF
jgi:hypothetical protein